MDHIISYKDHIGARAEKYYKGTLFAGKHLMVGINCFEPGQVQAVHDHSHADKVYLVMEGTGFFTVGDEQHTAGPGSVVFAPAGVPHGVENRGDEQLVVLVSIGPPPQ